MQWEFIVALLITLPVILFPVVLIWHMNIQGLHNGIKSKSQYNKPGSIKMGKKIQDFSFITVDQGYYENQLKSDLQ